MNVEFLNDFGVNNDCAYINHSDFNTKISYFNNKFSIFHLNINSVVANFDSLIHFLSIINYKFSVIVLTESKLDNSCDKLFNISGYNHISLNRNRHGGGIRLYYLCHLTVNICSDLSMVSDICEMLVAQISLNDNLLLKVACIYRPPSSSKRLFLEFIGGKLDRGFLSHSNTILIGDLNIDFLEKSSINRELYDYLFSKSFKILITIPTYIHTIKSYPSSCLDQIAINSSINCDSFVFNYKITDHLPIICILNIKYDDTLNTIKFRNFSSKNINNFLKDCDDIYDDMPTDFSNHDVNTATRMFTTYCIKISNKYFPLLSKQIGIKRIKSPWLCKSAIKCLDLKCKIYNRCKIINDDAFWEIYFLFDKLLKLLLKRSKDHYYRNFFNKNKKSSKKTWDKINDLISSGKNRHSKFQIVNEGEVVTSSYEVANLFNNYFLNIPVELLSKLPQSD